MKVMKNNPPGAERIMWTICTKVDGETDVTHFCYLLDRINWIFWIVFLYLKFPEEIPNEQSATPKRETLLSPINNRWDIGTLRPYFK